MTQQQIVKFQEAYLQANEQMSDTLTNALCQTFEAVTGYPPTRQLRDKIYDALQADR